MRALLISSRHWSNFVASFAPFSVTDWFSKDQLLFATICDVDGSFASGSLNTIGSRNCAGQSFDITP